MKRCFTRREEAQEEASICKAYLGLSETGWMCPGRRLPGGAAESARFGLKSGLELAADGDIVDLMTRSSGSFGWRWKLDEWKGRIIAKPDHAYTREARVNNTRQLKWDFCEKTLD